ncbi:hypothetical protein GGF50DRAFT_121919 [Schizophyllum commune]
MRRAIPDDVDTDVDACAAQRRFDRAGNGRNSHVHLAETPRSLLETPSTIPPRTCDDADAPLDGTPKPVGGILSTCVQRPSHDAGSLYLGRADGERPHSRTSTSTAKMPE